MTIEEKFNALCDVVLNGNNPEARQRLLDSRNVVSDPEPVIRRILLELGAPDHILGHAYAVEAIRLVISDRNLINNITFGLYPQVAKVFDTTPSRVERAIRHLIEVTWVRGDLDVMNKYFGNTILASKGKPTNSEFIARLANAVKAEMKG